MIVFSYLQITLAKGQLCLRRDSSRGRGRGIGEGGIDTVHAPVPGCAIGRGRVGGRGAVGGRARARAGARAAVVGQRREQGVLPETFALELQLQVLADLLWEVLILLLQVQLQLRPQLEEEKPDTFDHFVTETDPSLSRTKS